MGDTNYADVGSPWLVSFCAFSVLDDYNLLVVLDSPMCEI